MVTSCPGLIPPKRKGLVGVGWGSPATCLPLQIVAEEVSGTNDYVQLTFRAHKLDNKVGAPEPRPISPVRGPRHPHPGQIPGPGAAPFSLLVPPTPTPPPPQTSPGSWAFSRVSPGSVQQI